jgi:hypothetical protein
LKLVLKRNERTRYGIEVDLEKAFSISLIISNSIEGRADAGEVKQFGWQADVGTARDVLTRVPLEKTME